MTLRVKEQGREIFTSFSFQGTPQTIRMSSMDTDPTTELSAAEQKLREKQEWVKRLRLKFCIRPEFEITKNMIYPDGTLNQE